MSTVGRWLKNNKFDAGQFAIAQALLMTGPSAQRPTFRAIKKTLMRMRNKEFDNMIAYHRFMNWREAPSI